MYLDAAEDNIVGFANVTSLDLLLHLGATYSHITPTEISRNYNLITVPYDMQDPVETLFTQIDMGVRYTEAGHQLYHKGQYVKIAFPLILNTGALPEAIREWQRHTIANQTWAQFKIFFVNAHREHHLITVTAFQTGFTKLACLLDNKVAWILPKTRLLQLPILPHPQQLTTKM
jgi:hypothetical protein